MGSNKLSWRRLSQWVPALTMVDRKDPSLSCSSSLASMILVIKVKSLLDDAFMTGRLSSSILGVVLLVASGFGGVEESPSLEPCFGGLSDIIVGLLSSILPDVVYDPPLGEPFGGERMIFGY